jgi:hypothetical protein
MNLEDFESEKKLSAEEKEYQKLLEDEGFIYLGLQEGVRGDLVLFRTGDKQDWDASMSIPVEDFNLENLRRIVQEKKDKFKKNN